MVFALIITMIEETRRQIRLQSNASGLSMVSDRSSLVCCTKTDSSSSLISCSTLKTQLETTRRSLSTFCSLVHIYIYIFVAEGEHGSDILDIASRAFILEQSACLLLVNRKTSIPFSCSDPVLSSYFSCAVFVPRKTSALH